MYENGRKVNRHAAQEIHRDKMKRKFTPLEYSSFDSYADEMERQDRYHSRSWQNIVDNGGVPWHLRWWHDVHGFVRRSLLKKDAHTKERAHYRQELAHYDIEEDEIDMQKKFSDPWCWD